MIGTLAVDGCCYIWYIEEGTGRAAGPPSPFLAVPNVTAHHQRPVYQLYIIRCCAIIASEFYRVNGIIPEPLSVNSASFVTIAVTAFP